MVQIRKKDLAYQVFCYMIKCAIERYLSINKLVWNYISLMYIQVGIIDGKSLKDMTKKSMKSKSTT